MNLFTLRTISFSFLLAILPGLKAQERASPSVVANAESNFARTCAERGIRESFLQFFAPDSIIFAPGPQNGQKFYTDYKDKGRKLIWQPIFATIARSGELGLTSGPWEMQTSMRDQTPLAFGNFVSVWKKQPDQAWKVIVDVGVDHPRPDQRPDGVQLLLPDETSAKVDVDLARTALEKAEQNFAALIKQDAAGALPTMASENIRVFRDNSIPTVGKTAAKSLLNNSKITRKVSGGGMSESGDFAYRYGSYSTEPDTEIERGYFLSIWRMEGEQGWKLLLDLQKKAPPEKQ
jgi:ketosteroid isomerase-like protein